jgi:hypothetical protein
VCQCSDIKRRTFRIHRKFNYDEEDDDDTNDGSSHCSEV